MNSVDVAGESMVYRLPRPRAALWLAAMAEPSGSISTKSPAMVEFLVHTLGPHEAGELLVDALMERYDMDDIAGVVYDILGAGSPRKYWQDTFLARVAVANWPLVRGQLILRGIPDPMKQLPTLFALLDAVEAVYLEHADDAQRAEWDRNYLPPPDLAAQIAKREMQKQLAS